MENIKKCGCVVGILADYETSRMVTIEMLEKSVEYEMESYISNFEKGIEAQELYSLDDYFNKEKNTDLTRFEYCPKCGKKIDWEQLRKANNQKYYTFSKEQLNNLIKLKMAVNEHDRKMNEFIKSMERAILSHTDSKGDVDG